ncbi:acetyl-CoA acetyltransferase [Lachnoclostridium sp.]|uniref:acetyl-CoA acetyltransferase n=1 Tax=Lachnoclostridium sp. TaxID=2028282 RepID=UPI0028A0BB9E|nr:acetyl-CoA acetyltransferase [Lachnoclostridium sp.]
MDKRVYIIGGAQTDFSRNWSKEGKGVIALLKEVIDDGLKNINVTYHDIIELNKKGKVACFVGNFIAELYVNQGHLGALLTEVNPAFYGVPSARYEAACASGSVALDAAITKIKAEDYELVLVIGWELMKTVDAKTCGDFLGRAAFYQEEALGVEFPFPKLFGQLADESIIKYNIDEERYLDSLAKISVINYENAKRNPNAQTKKWFMSEGQAKARGTSTNSIIGGKLAISDCSQVTDGAAFVALASEKFVRDHYNSNKFPIVKGWGHRVAPMKFDTKLNESSNSKYILPWTRQAVLDAYERANLGVDDIDFFETHDCFTSSEYAAISAFGITEPGLEYEAVESGRIAFGGDKPINPSGGLIGCGHPVGASGVRMFLDLFKQVAGESEGYQLNKADNGLMLNIGGSATTNYVFIVGKE